MKKKRTIQRKCREGNIFARARLCFFALIFLSSCSTHIEEDEQEPILPIIPAKNDETFTRHQVGHVLYLIQIGKVQEAIDELFLLHATDRYIFHEGTLEKLGLSLLEQGAKSSDSQDLLTCLYGIGISHDERTLPIAEKALLVDDPQLQLVAVSVIASFDTYATSQLLEKAMKSNYLFVRLEAAYWLALKRSPGAYGQLVSLMSKVEPELHELFPRLFAMEGGPESTLELKRLLFDKNENVRRETILAIAQGCRDDFLEDIRLLAKEPSNVQQEACAYALGKFRDESSRSILEKLASSPASATRLAANLALFSLGTHEAIVPVLDAAWLGDCFAVYALGSVVRDDLVLVHLLNHPDVNVRVNAALALLQRRDASCLQQVADILIDSHRDYTFQPVTSHGGSLLFWKVTPSSSELLAKQPQFFEISLRMREETLVKAMELPEDDFLALARALLESAQFDLIPLTVRLLENLQSEKAILLLKEHEQRLGVPMVRAWCSLGLYRLKSDGHYADTIVKMVEKHEDKEVFQARPVLPWRMRTLDSQYQLTLEESCAFLIESFEALAMRQDEKGVEMLLKVIRDGNIHNRYTLAGLLMRAQA